jgi:hypothetical protein
VQPAGDENDQRVASTSRQPHRPLRGLRWKVWPDPTLFLANSALFQEVRTSPRVPAGKRPQMAASLLPGLKTTALPNSADPLLWTRS